MAEVPRYRIVEKIDAGGMAEVYRGLAESAIGGMRKPVAIKRILPSLSVNKRFVSMFLDEARVSMNLQHANIVGVFDIGIADRSYFIVMEFVDGANLKTIIESIRRQSVRIPVAQTLYILMEVCKGLEYAHNAVDSESNRPLMIVHRDISPPNILISRRGEIKLVDFGLAKATSQLEVTDPGVVKGKFSYLSPEAADGREVDHRADIFAVGILAYELLTGQRLYFGETDYKTVELVREAKVPSINTQNPDVKPELEAVVRKALARDPNERYQTAGDFQDSLAGYLFSQRLKVTNRDIEALVKSCINEKQRTQPKIRQPTENLIEELINEEIIKFTSIDPAAGALPGNTPEPAAFGEAPLDPGLFVDPGGWSDDDVGGQTIVSPSLTDAAPRTRKPTDGLEDLLEGEQAEQFGMRTPNISVQPTERGGIATNRNMLSAGGGAARTAPVRDVKILPIILVSLLLLGAAAALYVWKGHELVGGHHDTMQKR